MGEIRSEGEGCGLKDFKVKIAVFA